ncbi:MAG: hypothetical protein PHW31_03410 [Candidatus Pacebacteria bacterium]|nr:hypothetical protein [Candidatus Paceibacterota bacterium]
MNFEEAKTLEGQFMTPRRGINIGRQAKVLRVFGEPGERAWMAIEYLDTGRMVYECFPENFIFWEEYQKDPFIPSSENMERGRQIVADWNKAPLCIFDRKRYAVLYRGAFRQGVLDWFIKNDCVKPAGTLGQLLKAHGKSYKDFVAKRRRQNKYVYRPNVPMYEL